MVLRFTQDSWPQQPGIMDVSSGDPMGELSPVAREIAGAVCLANYPAATDPCKVLCEDCCRAAAYSLDALLKSVLKKETLEEVIEKNGGILGPVEWGKWNQRMDTRREVIPLCQELKDYEVNP